MGLLVFFTIYILFDVFDLKMLFVGFCGVGHGVRHAMMLVEGKGEEDG